MLKKHIWDISISSWQSSSEKRKGEISRNRTTNIDIKKCAAEISRIKVHYLHHSKYLIPYKDVSYLRNECLGLPESLKYLKFRKLGLMRWKEGRNENSRRIRERSRNRHYAGYVIPICIWLAYFQHNGDEWRLWRMHEGAWCISAQFLRDEVDW